MGTDQGLIDFLLDPSHYLDYTSSVTHVETHISHVFLCDHFVYKLKKSINFGFLDFSTLDKRHFFCNQELLLNSRLAREIYLAVEPIYRSGAGYSFYEGEKGTIADYVVKMKRIPMDRLLLQLIMEGKALYSELEGVGKALARFHKDAPVYRGGNYGGLDNIIAATEENFAQLEAFQGITLDDSSFLRLKDYTRDFIAARGQRFDHRRDLGYVKECHGDLHCEHVCLEEPPIIFDCIEFNEAFRIIDVLEDIAFLFMDLEYRGRFDLSKSLFRAYFSLQEDTLDNEFLTFYKVYRAIVRGKVEGFRAVNTTEELSKAEALRAARSYLGLADYYIRQGKKPFNPIIFMGLSGSGKSTIAQDFAEEAIILRSDSIRKELIGIDKETHRYTGFGEGIYDEDVTEKVYGIILDKTMSAARTRKRVVVDATYLKAAQREMFYEACIDRGFNPFFVHCFADEEVLLERIKQRMADAQDVSDAHPAILARQMKEREEPEELPSYRILKINTEDAIHRITLALKEFLS